MLTGCPIWFRFLVAASVAGSYLGAAEPKLEHLDPAAAALGHTVTVTASGKFEPWPPQVWVDAPGIAFQPLAAKGKFEVRIDPTAPVGPHLVRLHNQDGASTPRFLIVTAEPDRPEVEPNDDYHAPQVIDALPTVISGRLDKTGDVDGFSVTLKAGETLVAWVEAYVLASTFDSMLRVIDEAGVQQAFNHDGRTLDSFLAWTAPRTGRYVVQLMGFRYPATAAAEFAGGAGCVYRLHLTNGPFLRFTWPLAVQRGVKNPVQLIGWNLLSEHEVFDAESSAAAADLLPLPWDGIQGDSAIPVSGWPEGTESEPNDLASQAQELQVPSGVSGKIDRPFDEDRYLLKAAKGRSYAVSVEAGSRGSMLDPWLKVESPAGKVLAKSDFQSTSRNANLSWTSPADEPVVLAIGDVTHRGGPDYYYHLTVVEAVPRCTASIEQDAIAIVPGKTAELKVSFKRVNGARQAIQILAQHLPAGITAPPVEAPAKDGTVVLKFTAAPDAPPAALPIEVVMHDLSSGRDEPIVAMLISSGENNGVPQGYGSLVIDHCQPFLTVTGGPTK